MYRRFCDQLPCKNTLQNYQLNKEHTTSLSLSQRHLPFLFTSKMMSAGAGGGAGAGARNRSPFTATQWQELEHQALIFKYIISGIPIPPDLLYSVKRSLDCSISSRLFPQHPVGWACFEMGFGRKVDPEPGRCRRTDGKKWRCSKEAYPDSKYCERHMHRGRNRSRKPVEVTPASAATATATATNLSPPISSINRNLSTNTSTSSFCVSPFSSSVTSEIHPHRHPCHETTLYPFLYSHSSSRPPVPGFLPQNNTTHQLFLDSGSYSPACKDYREGVDDRVFLPDASMTARSLPDSYQRLTMGSHKGYSRTQFQSLSDSAEQQQQQQEQRCFLLGSDFKSPGEIKTEKKAEIQKPLHQFFGEWPPKNTDSWLDLASNSSVPTDD
ncbi:growth-regulating factor 5-like isoform X2 [Corylus avellana]|uniref:growth-regulating factor 5-like isoform X2 n=1 Tax=Corylus avellana TaxID=13451 RepID=UPI00286C857C|nr:growth-regulating factor 5-like isoform X2 [Corylus avellana]